MNRAENAVFSTRKEKNLRSLLCSLPSLRRNDVLFFGELKRCRDLVKRPGFQHRRRRHAEHVVESPCQMSRIAEPRRMRRTRQALPTTRQHHRLRQTPPQQITTERNADFVREQMRESAR